VKARNRSQPINWSLARPAAVLEDLPEVTCAALEGTESLHYLLATPFRPPLTRFRFGTRSELSLFYGSPAKTVLRKPHYRLRSAWHGPRPQAS
jgi:hypothetical protein